MYAPTTSPILLNSVAFAVAIVVLLIAPTAAHQRQLLQIGATDYLVVVGFLSEPVFTGDKSGVDLSIMTADPSSPTDSHAPNAKPLEHVEKTLKVEVKAGPHAKVFELRPAYRAPGRYHAVFYPTVPTTYGFRFVGTVEGVAVDITFTCNPLGHVSFEDRTPLKLSNGVTRKVVIGSFGCPAERADAEFPPAPRQ
jgi:hypothetical protein